MPKRRTNTKIYLEEIKYQSSELKEQIFSSLAGYDARVILDESVPAWLFGDPGRIGQMVVKIVKMILAQNSKAKILINLDSKKFAYATNLNITLNLSKLSDDEIVAFRSFFEEVNINFKNEKFDAVFLYLLFEQMFVDYEGEKTLVFNIHAFKDGKPWSALEEEQIQVFTMILFTFYQRLQQQKSQKDPKTKEIEKECLKAL